MMLLLMMHLDIPAPNDRRGTATQDKYTHWQGRVQKTGLDR
jgi:hypothetical protein